MMESWAFTYSTEALMENRITEEKDSYAKIVSRESCIDNLLEFYWLAIKKR